LNTPSQYADSANLDARIELHRRYSLNPQTWFDWLFDRLVIPDTSHILELGCGTGELWRVNEGRIPRGWRMTLTDASEGMLATASRNLADLHEPFAFIPVDAVAIPFPDHTFDAVIANHMLYHVPERQCAIAEIRRVLRPGGVLFASTTGAGHLQELQDALDAIGAGHALALPEPSFTLETGRAQLGEWFPEIRLERYPDALLITKAEPLVAYVRSLLNPHQPNEAALQRFESWARSEIESEGRIRITKDSGVFIAS